jgi:hypothetical protein
MFDPYQPDTEPGLQTYIFLIEAYALIRVLAEQGYTINEQQKDQIKRLLQREPLSLQQIVTALHLTK